MRIASWNVNSLKARFEHVLSYCQSDRVDVLLLQELKMTDDAISRTAFEDIGWYIETHGQKTYNGVAILSRFPIKDVMRDLPCLCAEDEADEQSRYIEASIEGFRLASLYLPNGNPCPGPKFDYKLKWMARLQAHAQQLLVSERPIILAGDYNVIPQALDCYDPSAWVGDALWHPESRAAFFRLAHLLYLLHLKWADHILLQKYQILTGWRHHYRFSGHDKRCSSQYQKRLDEENFHPITLILARVGNLLFRIGNNQEHDQGVLLAN